jgi:hypothetical protein
MSDANAHDRLGGDAGPQQPRAATIWSEEEWTDIHWHALMTTDQDQRHKAIFVDTFVPMAMDQIGALRVERSIYRTVLGYALDSLRVVLVQHCMDNGMSREDAEKAEWQAWTHPANTIRAIQAALAEAEHTEASERSEVGSTDGQTGPGTTSK